MVPCRRRCPKKYSGILKFPGTVPVKGNSNCESKEKLKENIRGNSRGNPSEIPGTTKEFKAKPKARPTNYNKIRNKFRKLRGKHTHTHKERNPSGRIPQPLRPNLLDRAGFFPDSNVLGRLDAFPHALQLLGPQRKADAPRRNPTGVVFVSNTPKGF